MGILQHTSLCKEYVGFVQAVALSICEPWQHRFLINIQLEKLPDLLLAGRPAASALRYVAVPKYYRWMAWRWKLERGVFTDVGRYPIWDILSRSCDWCREMY